MEDRSENNEMLHLTTELVAAHISNNSVATADLPLLIKQVYNTLNSLGEPEEPEEVLPEPAVPIRKSVQPDYIVCLEDGKQLKMLKRHLSSKYDMTPEEYKRRWSLPDDYPMVAPNYANKRSELARSIGLGRKSKGRPRKS